MLISIGIRLLNLMLKALVAWCTYSITTWLQAPEWLVISLTAIGAVQTKLEYALITYEAEPFKFRF